MSVEDAFAAWLTTRSGALAGEYFTEFRAGWLDEEARRSDFARRRYFDLAREAYMRGREAYRRTQR